MLLEHSLNSSSGEAMEDWPSTRCRMELGVKVKWCLVKIVEVVFYYVKE